MRIVLPTDVMKNKTIDILTMFKIYHFPVCGCVHVPDLRPAFIGRYNMHLAFIMSRHYLNKLEC